MDKPIVRFQGSEDDLIEWLEEEIDKADANLGYQPEWSLILNCLQVIMGKMEKTKMATEIERYPYYCFKTIRGKKYLEGRFWNQGGKQLAIVAITTQVGDFGDWAAYIGTDAPDSFREEDTLLAVADHGCKLSEGDARHFFPDIKLPYRN